MNAIPSCAKSFIIDWNSLDQPVVAAKSEEDPGFSVASGAVISQLIHPGDIDRVRADLSRKVASDADCIVHDPFRIRVDSTDSSFVWVTMKTVSMRNSTDRSPRYCSTICSVSSIMESVESLYMERNRYKRYLDSIPGFTCLLSLELEILDVSLSLEDFLGYSTSEIIGRNLRDTNILTPESFRQVQHDVRNLVSEEESLLSDCTFVSGSGDTVTFEVRSNLSRSHGKPDLIFSVARDITSWKALEKNRLETENALRESEEYFRALIENASDVISILDRHGAILYESPSHTRVLGYESTQLLGESVFKFVHPDDIKGISKKFESLLNRPGEMENVSFRFRHKNGEWISLEGTGRNLLHDPVVKGIVVNYRDVTDKNRVEKSLIASEARFRNLLDELDQIPVQGYDENRKVIFWNRGSEIVYGFSREEALGSLLEDLIIPTHMRDIVVKSTLDWFATGVAEPPGEMTLKDKAGNDVQVYSSHIMRTVSSGKKEMFCVDIDLRKLHLAEAQGELLLHAIEHTADVVMIIDPLGFIEYLNPAFETVTGHRRSDFIATDIRESSTALMNVQVFSNLWETIKSGKIWTGQLNGSREDGSSYVLSATVSPVFDSMGSIVSYVAVERDITEELQKEKDRRDIEDAFRQTQRVEAIGRLAGGVAHDLNNLLTPILGYGEMLLGETGFEDFRRDQVDQIVSAGLKARDLVRQLLAFSRKQTLEYKSLNINRVVLDFEKLLRRTIRENIEIQLDLDETIPPVNADIGQLEQVIMNLCVNARDAMPEGGCLKIRTSVVVIDEISAAEHCDTPLGRYVTLAVTDNGSGIEKSVLGQIFEPFFTTKGESGTGLGLSTVFGIIKQHKGDVTVSSDSDGTTFCVYIPVSEKVPAASNSRKEDGRIPPGSGTILLVEDDESVRELTASILEVQGYNVLRACDGKSALALLAVLNGGIDLLLTDVIMPDMNGIELYTKISQEHSGVPVLYMSGYTSDVVENWGVLQESKSFIEKPFTAKDLLSHIVEVMSC